MSPEWEFVMPFLPVVSNGGPFDDCAYTCGWEAGQIAMLLQIGARQGLPLEVQVHVENVEQLDLVAMLHGFSMERRPLEGEPGWAFVRFTKHSGAPHAPPSAP